MRSQTDKQILSLTGLVGAVTAGCLYVIVPEYEGVVLKGYLDPVGIPTKCMGDTSDVVLGKAYSLPDCFDSLERQLIRYAHPVLTCTPQIRDKPHTLAAAISFAYNVGPEAYCRSEVARRFQTGDFKGGCARLSRWVYAGGRKLNGLVRRRAAERKLCERDA